MINNLNDTTMETLISMPLCKSRMDTTVVKFLTENELNADIVRMIDEGQLWGVYFDGANVVAEDIWGDVHENVLKKNDTIVETLDEAIENGLEISAVYAPNGEVVKCWNHDNLTEVEFHNGTFGKVDRNDLVDFSWK